MIGRAFPFWLSKFLVIFVTFFGLVPSTVFAIYFNIYETWAVIFFALFSLHGLYGMKLYFEQFAKRKLNSVEI